MLRMMNSRSLHYGRDDTSVLGLGFVMENLGGPRGALQIPPLRYASVGMTKGRRRFHSDSMLRMMNSRSLHYGRDDTSVLGLGFVMENLGGPRGALQIPPLRYASVGMRKGRRRFHSDSMLRMMNSRSLHYATLRSG